MKRKGFTLIELLAVIVILAIIAVIATPIIVGLIEDARKAAFERSVEMILSATDLNFGLQESLENFNYTIKDGSVESDIAYEFGSLDKCVDFFVNFESYSEEYATIECKSGPTKNGFTLIEYAEIDKSYGDILVEAGVLNEVTSKVNVNNIEGLGGMITYDSIGKREYAIHNDKWCITKLDGMEKQEITEYDGYCTIATDVSCFTYSPFSQKEYTIVNAEECKSYFVDNYGFVPEEAETQCNNIPNEMNNGLPLTEFLSLLTEETDEYDSMVIPLLEANIIKKTENTNAIAITGYNFECTRDVIIPKSIDGKSITAIADEAFTPMGMGLSSVIMPNSITHIGNWAFAGNLLTSIEIPNGVKHIGNSAFQYNVFNSEIVIPDSVISIGEYAFAGDSYYNWGPNKITGVKLGKGLGSIGPYAFNYNEIDYIDLSDATNLSYIGNNAFGVNNISGELDLSSTNLKHIVGFNDNKITSVKFPLDIVEIGEDAFYFNHISGHLDLSVYENLTCIGEMAFGDDSNDELEITSISLPLGIQQIRDQAFFCQGLSGELDLSRYENLTYVSGFTYNHITSIKLPENVESIGLQAFYNNDINGELNLNIYPNLKNIGNLAFAYNEITSVNLPSNIEKMGDCVFCVNNIDQ